MVGFLLTGMLDGLVYARLWRKSGVVTDLEFYELRYSGKEAAFLRGFRALYLGVFFNVMIMASVCLAAIKIGGSHARAFSRRNGVDRFGHYGDLQFYGRSKRGYYHRLFQFILAMGATFWAAYYLIDSRKLAV